MRTPTVILAAGEFPRCGSAAERLLVSARRVICCDGAADAYFRRTGRAPDFTVGDGDSVRACRTNFVRIDEQDTNDLEKAYRFCVAKGWRRPVVLGAGGKRDDHLLGNVFRCLEFGLEMVTNFGRFVPVEGRRRLTAVVGCAVSVFAVDPETAMTSKGLEWPLDEVRFRNLYCATLNRATSTRIELTATRRVLVYLETK